MFGTSSLKGVIKPVPDTTVPANALCSGYDVHSYMVAITSALKVGLSVSTQGSVAIYTGADMTLEDFKAAMSGVMLYYELETPEITDISDILTADNLLEVEGGGTITMVNEYRYDVPSEITYQLKEASE